MRVWDQIPPENLCDQHLLGEHREIHCIWSVHKRDTSGGYGSHPEVKRWKGHLEALRKRHAKVAREMQRRGMKHESNLANSKWMVVGESDRNPKPWDDQKAKLAAKGCACKVGL